MLVHGIGARRGFDVERQSEAYAVLRAWGLPTSDEVRVLDDIAAVEEFVDLPRRAPPRPLPRDRRHRRQGRRGRRSSASSARPRGRRAGPSPSSTRRRRSTPSSSTSASTSAAPAGSRPTASWSPSSSPARPSSRRRCTTPTRWSARASSSVTPSCCARPVTSSPRSSGPSSTCATAPSAPSSCRPSAPRAARRSPPRRRATRTSAVPTAARARASCASGSSRSPSRGGLDIEALGWEGSSRCSSPGIITDEGDLFAPPEDSRTRATTASPARSSRGPALHARREEDRRRRERRRRTRPVGGRGEAAGRAREGQDAAVVAGRRGPVDPARRAHRRPGARDPLRLDGGDPGRARPRSSRRPRGSGESSPRP